jgi:hypothetical protein
VTLGGGGEEEEGHTLSLADNPAALGPSELLQIDCSFPFLIREVTGDSEVSHLEVSIQVHE